MSVYFGRQLYKIVCFLCVNSLASYQWILRFEFAKAFLPERRDLPRLKLGTSSEGLVSAPCHSGAEEHCFHATLKATLGGENELRAWKVLFLSRG